MASMEQSACVLCVGNRKPKHVAYSDSEAGSQVGKAKPVTDSLHAGVMELVDIQDLKSWEALKSRVGSIPTPGTKIPRMIVGRQFLLYFVDTRPYLHFI